MFVNVIAFASLDVAMGRVIGIGALNSTFAGTELLVG
jgi:hypothetical protein